jgi:hypothetical protein
MSAAFSFVKIGAGGKDGRVYRFAWWTLPSGRRGETIREQRQFARVRKKHKLGAAETLAASMLEKR